MNITLTDNVEDRQVDKAMSMVGHAPEGAMVYEILIYEGTPYVYGVKSEYHCGGPCLHQLHSSGVFAITIEDLSAPAAMGHAAEVMASYLED